MDYKNAFRLSKITSLEVRRKVAIAKTRTTRADLEYLRKVWGKVPLRRICAKVDLDAATVRAQARKLGLPLLVERWHARKVRAGIRRALSQGRALNSGAARVHSHKLYKAARAHFGSWGAAVEQAGVAYSSVRRIGPFEVWSKEKIRREIVALLAGGRSIPYRTLERRHSKLYAAARNYFGNWKSALRAAERHGRS